MRKRSVPKRLHLIIVDQLNKGLWCNMHDTKSFERWFIAYFLNLYFWIVGCYMWLQMFNECSLWFLMFVKKTCILLPKRLVKAYVFFLRSKCLCRNSVYSYCSVNRFCLSFTGSCLPNLYFVRSLHIFICRCFKNFLLTFSFVDQL